MEFEDSVRLSGPYFEVWLLQRLRFL